MPCYLEPHNPGDHLHLVADQLHLVAEQLRLANLLTAAYTLGSSEATAALRINIGAGDAPVYRLRPEIADLLGLTPDDGVVDAEIHCEGCQCPPAPCPDCGSTDVLSARHIVDCPGQ